MHIKELLENKYIQESNSKHTSPAFIVNKHSEQKRGKSRMVIDYRNLNAKTKTYNYPIPNKILKKDKYKDIIILVNLTANQDFTT